MAATITPESVWAHIPPRARDSHKGSFGAVLVVAGSACYRGAASLAVEGALRTGAGNQNCHCKNLSLVTIVAFFVRALPLLPKEYRFLHTESSTAHFMQLDSCCIFFRTMMEPQIFLHLAHGGKTLFVQMRERSPGTQKWPPGRAAIPFSLFKGVRTGVR